MNENDTIPSDDYLKKFNEGYLLKKFEPVLAEKLAEALKGKEHAQGFMDGMREGTIEKVQAHQPSFLYNKAIDTDHNIESKKDVDLDRD